MQVNWGPGLHVAVGRRVNSSAYEQYIGLWSRLFVPAVLAAAGVEIRRMAYLASSHCQSVMRSRAARTRKMRLES